MRAFAGFAASFSGKWFGGYARSDVIQNYCELGRRSIIEDAKSLGNVTFAHSDFSQVEVPDGCIVYADPPYSGTADYKTIFSSLRFWHFARKWSERARVYVSEYRAPPDFVPIWEHSLTGAMKNKKVTEKVFVHKDQV